MPRKAKKRKIRLVVDTSVLVAGISGFKETYVPARNPSADVLHKWAVENNFVWLVSEEILDEYKEVLKRLHVRSHVIGRIVNLIRERAEEVKARYSLEISTDPGDDPFASVPKKARRILSSLSIRKTFRKTGSRRLSSHRID